MTNTTRTMSRILATDLLPGDELMHRGLSQTVYRVTIRRGFSGPIAVIVDFCDGRHGTYSPTGRVTVVR